MRQSSIHLANFQYAVLNFFYLRLLFKICTLSGSWPISEGLGSAGATYTAASTAQRRRVVLENAIISESRFLN